MVATNDITGDRIVSKLRGDKEKFNENLEKIFGKKELKKRDDDYWKKLNEETAKRLGSVTNEPNKVES